MRSIFATTATAAIVLASSATLLAQPTLPDRNAPSPMMHLPVDHSLTNSMCGTLESSANSVCKNGVVFNKEGNVERRDEQRAKALAEVKSVSEQRKLAAKKLAERVIAGADVPPTLVDQVRSGLSRDLDLWRAESGMDDKAFAAAQARWMRPPGSLTPAEWVLWRAAWFDERDKLLAAKH